LKKIEKYYLDIFIMMEEFYSVTFSYDGSIIHKEYDRQIDRHARKYGGELSNSKHKHVGDTKMERHLIYEFPSGTNCDNLYFMSDAAHNAIRNLDPSFKIIAVKKIMYNDGIPKSKSVLYKKDTFLSESFGEQDMVSSDMKHNGKYLMNNNYYFQEIQDEDNPNCSGFVLTRVEKL
jgi:hypothetical protein